MIEQPPGGRTDVDAARQFHVLVMNDTPPMMRATLSFCFAPYLMKLLDLRGEFARRLEDQRVRILRARACSPAWSASAGGKAGWSCCTGFGTPSTSRREHVRDGLFPDRGRWW